MLEKVRIEMTNNELDGLWVTDKNSLKYLFNLNIETGERFIGVFLTQDKVQLVLNKLFTAENFNHEIKVVYDHDNIHQILSDITQGQKVGLDKVMEGQYVLNLIKNKPEIEFVMGSDCVDQLRAIKNSDQIEKMIKASALNDKVMELVKANIQISMTEIEVAKMIEQYFSEFNSEVSFETIIAFGDHGVDPHAIVSDRRLKENESIIVDMGCIVDGYCSDMTRTLFVNHNPVEELYNLVLKANTEAIKAIKPGVRFSDIDKVARDIITEGGYGEYFTHRLGHGIGQEVHEPYDVSMANNQLIKPGMCFSIEPGIYKPNENAIRIEDLVYINEDGYPEILNHVSKTEVILYR